MVSILIASTDNATTQHGNSHYGYPLRCFYNIELQIFIYKEVIFSGFYVNDCLTGSCLPKATPLILKESAATAWVDGCSALGATVGNFCMDLAIKKAKECGVGWVAAKGEFCL